MIIKELANVVVNSVIYYSNHNKHNINAIHVNNKLIKYPISFGLVFLARYLDVLFVRGIRGLSVHIRIYWSLGNIMLILISKGNKICRNSYRKNGRNLLVISVKRILKVCIIVVNVGLICARNAEKNESLSINFIN